MTDGDSIAQVTVVVLLLVLAVPALSTAYDYAGTPLSEEDTATVDYNNDTNLSVNSTLEGYSETITVTVNDNQLVGGTDYLYNSSAGSIDWQNTANTSSGDTATIEYQAYQRTGESELAWSVISPFFALFGLFALVASVRAIWTLTAEVWDL